MPTWAAVTVAFFNLVWGLACLTMWHQAILVHHRNPWWWTLAILLMVSLGGQSAKFKSKKSTADDGDDAKEARHA